MRGYLWRFQLIVSVIVCLYCSQLYGSPLPKIAIVIDDLGLRQDLGERTVNLPGPIACSFLPHEPVSRQLAQLAHQAGKEVLLHQPMQSVAPLPIGKGAIVLDMTRQELERTLLRNLEAIPHVSGLNNHMGSLVTQHPGHMSWVMALMAKHNKLFFVDSRTTVLTVAEKTAREFHIPVMRRHVFLDHPLAGQGIDFQFKRLIKMAQRNGYALAIGHPTQVTLDYLESVLPFISMYGVELVSVSTLISVSQSSESVRSEVEATISVDYPTDY